MCKRFALLLLVLFVGIGFSQSKKDEDRQIITLCWDSDLDTAARYLIYFNKYNSVDTSWNMIGTSKAKSFQISKQSFKGDIAFGVKSVYMGDTSALHKSIEATACASADSCGAACTTSGPWYLSWHIRKPTSIKVIGD